MAIEKLNETLEPPNPQAVIRYVQFDAVRIIIGKDHFDDEIVRLAGPGLHPGASVPRTDIESLLQTNTVANLAKRYDVVLTNAQYKKLIDYVEKGAYFYRSQGNSDDAQFVLAFSYGERYPVNSQIRYEIETTFGSKEKPPKIYAQWEIADLPSFAPGAALTFNRIAMSPGAEYLYSWQVRDEFMAMSGAGRGAKVFLACQAWHAPRCWRLCEEKGLAVVGGLFVNLFSKEDPQPWVRDAMSWVTKEAQK